MAVGTRAPAPGTGTDDVESKYAWQRLVIAPPGDADTLSQLSFASASIDTTMGLAASSWDVTGGAYPDAVCGAAPENGMLTPSMKLKRRKVIETYGPVIEKLYTSRQSKPRSRISNLT